MSISGFGRDRRIYKLNDTTVKFMTHFADSALHNARSPLIFNIVLWHVWPYISGARVMAACTRKLSIYVGRKLQRPEVRVMSALILAISGNASRSPVS